MNISEDNEPMISLRELNQRSGQIVRLVAKTGRAVTITDHGRPLARLEPFEQALTPYEKYLREGKIRPATSRSFTLPEGISAPKGTYATLMAERED